MKPDVINACKFAGANLSFIDFDELEEEDPLKGVKSLPTLQLMVDKEWKSFGATEYAAWGEALLSQVVLTPSNNEDF
jgi:hypothetical protein